MPCFVRSILMTLIELGLILVYTAVLLIKSCDPTSLTAGRLDYEVSAAAVQSTVRLMCSGYGFGDTADGELQSDDS